MSDIENRPIHTAYGGDLVSPAGDDDRVHGVAAFMNSISGGSMDAIRRERGGWQQ